MKCDDMIAHQSACLMASSLACLFKPISEIHEYYTGMVSSNKLSVDIPIRTETHKKSLLDVLDHEF